MNKNTFNLEIEKHIEKNQSEMSTNALSFLKNSKVEKENAYDLPDSPSDYSVTVWHNDKLAHISFMHNCEPNSIDLSLNADELFEVYEIYCDLGLKQLL